MSSENAADRFFAYAAMRCVAADPLLVQHLVLRGGAALWMCFGGRRAEDVDFSLSEKDLAHFRNSPDMVSLRVDNALTQNLPRIFPDAGRWSQKFQKRLRLDVAIDPVDTEHQVIQLAGLNRSMPGAEVLRVTTLEQMAADKLAALIRRHTRSALRCKDALDLLALTDRYQDRLNASHVARLVYRRSSREAWSLSEARDLLRTTIKAAAAEAYGSAQETTAQTTIAFEPAWERVCSLIHVISGSESPPQGASEILPGKNHGRFETKVRSG